MANPYNATRVARLIIDRCEENERELSGTKLQALLYFTQTQFIMEDQKICFRDPMYAGEYGPYILQVQERLQGLPDGVVSFAELKKQFPDEKRMDPHSMAVMYHAIDPAAALSEESLVKVAMGQKPYRNALEEESRQILIRDIRAFYHH